MSVDPLKYLTFTVTPNAGYQMDITSLTWQGNYEYKEADAKKGTPAQSGPTSVDVYYKIGSGSATLLGNFGSGGKGAWSEKGGSGAPFPLTDVKDAITFYFDAYGVINAADNKKWLIDHVILEGTTQEITAVPEPATYLSGVALLGLLAISLWRSRGRGVVAD